MDAVDRLGWAAGVAFAGDGASVGVRSNDAAVLERVEAVAPPLWRRQTSPLVERLYSLRVADPSGPAGSPRAHHLFMGADRRVSSRDLGAVLETLESDLHVHAALSARQALFVHAGVVGWKGRAILLPAPTMRGKSSLVAALVTAGASYFSDEYAVLDERGWVQPYPKRLSLRTPAGGRKARVTAEDLGGHRGAGALPIGLVAVTAYRDGAPWEPRVLTPAQALLALLENTPLARERTAFALEVLRAVVRDAVAVKSERAAAAEVVPALLTLAEQCAADPDCPAGAVEKERTYAPTGT